ncbi:hypothetical protein H6P81_017682 [Aristolochia fimbriata]|uniref:Amino acid transporter transmembrane domain-containing protein n=1 Tax=Aristolochia fimbriata TaxID=158543 RepID=A0AAV7E356_ARIFI|nr:hypothetical protein H6P81_017682 [Aristolochia fimbriata]
MLKKRVASSICDVGIVEPERIAGRGDSGFFISRGRKNLKESARRTQKGPAQRQILLRPFRSSPRPDCSSGGCDLSGSGTVDSASSIQRRMKNSVSENSLYIESEEEDIENDGKDSLKDAEDDGNESVYSESSSVDSPREKPPSSYNPSWPQSYRQSIDMYSSVPSPSIGFLGTPSLGRLGSSFLSSSLTRRHTPEVLSNLTKPLLPSYLDQQQEQLRQPSSHDIPPTPPTRKPSLRKSYDAKPSKASHELPISRQSTSPQAVLNGINVLCGVGILSTPYAAKEGGWLGLSILLIFSVLSWYTGILLRHCLDSAPGLETYPDIGQAAFGSIGRFAISIILYMELYACCVDYIILESDNLSSLFPNAHLSLGGVHLNAHYLFALLTTLAVLPTCWLRDMSVLSYISAGGVIASILVVLCLFWIGLVDKVGFENKGTTLNLTSLPVAIGLYGYCYSGHAVFPNIYTSMKKPSAYPFVLLICFGLCTALYAGTAVMGYTMFGESTESQFTLNMPKDLVASKIAVWTTVVNPFTKYPFSLGILIFTSHFDQPLLSEMLVHPLL